MARGLLPGQVAQALGGGFMQGQQDARQREMADLQLEEAKGNAEYTKTQRARESRQYDLQDEARAFDVELKKTAQHFIASDGQDVKPIIDLHNRSYPNGRQIMLGADEKGRTVLNVTDDQGQSLAKPRVMKDDEVKKFGMTLVYGMSDPKGYIQNRLKAMQPEKGRFSESRQGVIDTATGAFKPHAKGVGEDAGMPKGYNQQRAYDQISKLVGERLGGKYDDAAGKWIKPPDDPELATRLTSLGQKYERESPGSLSPGELVDNVFGWSKSLVREEDARAAARREAEAKTGYLSTDESDLGMPRKNYIEQRTQEIMGEGNRRAGPLVPQVGAGASGTPSARPAIPPPEQRKVGQVFNSPRGPGRWTGTGCGPGQ